VDAVDTIVRERAAVALARNALERPADARSAAMDVADRLAATEPVRGYATLALASVAVAEPDCIVPGDPALGAPDDDAPEWFAEALAFVRGRAGDEDASEPATALAARLDDDRPPIRALAALAAGTLDAAYSRHLVDRLEDDALVVRAAGARGLAAIADRDPFVVASSANSLVAVLADPLADDPVVVASVLDALGAVARVDPDAIDDVDAVARRLTHPDPNVRAAAVRLVGHVDLDGCELTLQRLRGDGTDHVQRAAVAALDGATDDALDDETDGGNAGASRLARLSPTRLVDRALSSLGSLFS